MNGSESWDVRERVADRGSERATLIPSPLCENNCTISQKGALLRERG